MKEKKQITFFVLGVDRASKGRYLAKILTTQQGVYSAVFDFENRLLDVDYNPEEVDLKALKKMTYFKDCIFISDKTEIERQIRLLRKQNLLTKIVNRSCIALVVIVLYLIANEILERPNMWWGYALFFCVLILTLGGYYLKRKVLNQIKSPEITD